ncbi:hypothetical protein JMUB7533_26830 [Staphylococcus aureus]
MDPILGKGIDKIIEGASKGPVETFSKTWEAVSYTHLTLPTKLEV